MLRKDIHKKPIICFKARVKFSRMTDFIYLLNCFFIKYYFLIKYRLQCIVNFFISNYFIINHSLAVEKPPLYHLFYIINFELQINSIYLFYMNNN